MSRLYSMKLRKLKLNFPAISANGVAPTAPHPYFNDKIWGVFQHMQLVTISSALFTLLLTPQKEAKDGC